MKVYKFETIIQKHDGMDAAYIEFPYSVEKEFGTRGRVKVKVNYEGHEYRGSLVNMGLKSHCIGVTHKVRKAIEKEPGDKIKVKLYEDTEPRVVQLPDKFSLKLKQNQQAQTFFNNLSYTRQKAFVTWITSAKRIETKKRRLEKSLQLLENSINSPY